MKIRTTFVLCFDSRLCNTVIKSKWISLILVLLERMKWFDYIVWMEVARPQTDVSSIRISGVWELTFHSPTSSPKKWIEHSLRYVCRSEIETTSITSICVRSNKYFNNVRKANTLSNCYLRKLKLHRMRNTYFRLSFALHAPIAALALTISNLQKQQILFCVLDAIV